MGLLRKIVFYFFSLIFIVFCPLIVLYALGYLFKPGHEQGIVKTGLIYAATVPAGASVTLSGKLLEQPTPSLMLDLMPGEYPLTLSLKGYKPWNQNLPVEAGKATVIDKILLLPEEFKPEILAEESFRDFVPFARGTRLLLTRTSKLSDVQVFDTRSEEVRPLVSSKAGMAGVRFSRFFVREDSPLILFETDEASNKHRYLLFKADDEVPQDLTPLFLESPETVVWNGAAEDVLFAVREGTVNRVDAGKNTVSPGFLKDVRGIGLFEKGVYALKKDNTLLMQEMDGEGRKLLSRDADLVKTLLGETDEYSLHVFSRDLVLFLGRDGKLVSNRLPYVHTETGVSGMEFYGGTFLVGPRKVLAWGPDSISVLDFRRMPAEKEIFEKGVRLISVFRDGSDIRQAFWVFEGAHILFRDGQHVSLLELEGFGQSQVNPIVDVKKDSMIYYSDDTGKLYYLAESGGALSALEILPKRKIKFLTLPNLLEERKESEIREV